MGKADGPRQRAQRRRRRSLSESTWSDRSRSPSHRIQERRSRPGKRPRETSLSRSPPALAAKEDDRRKRVAVEERRRTSISRSRSPRRRPRRTSPKEEGEDSDRTGSERRPVPRENGRPPPRRPPPREPVPEEGWWTRRQPHGRRRPASPPPAHKRQDEERRGPRSPPRQQRRPSPKQREERPPPSHKIVTERPKREEEGAPPPVPAEAKAADTAPTAAEDKELAEYAARKIQRKTVDVIGRTGGVYIPPFKLAELQKTVTDKSSPEYQRQSWEALRKSINGLVNKVNIGNITNLVQDLFRENLVRGRGLIARAIIRAQMASPGFTNVYAALLSILNSKLPELGDLVLRRILLQFRRAYRRNDKIVCKACMKLLAHLVNQKMVHELLALQLAMLLLEKLTDDSVELCVEFMQEVGQVLQDISPQAFRAINDRLRVIAQEGTVDTRVQYIIEGFQRTVATKFAEYPGVIPELDLVEEEDKITHEVDLLDPDIKADEMLNIFKAEEPDVFLKNEAAWADLSAEILGEQGGEEGEAETSEDSEAEEEEEFEQPAEKPTVEIHDMTEKDTIALRKTIYLTIMSSANYEECLHKILKLNIKEGQEIQVCTMLIDCNAMERTFQRFYPLQAERLCRLKPVYQECFMGCLERQYNMIHHLETNKIRSTAKFFAHLLHTDALPWACLELFVLTEQATTSASRIFIKVLFQEFAEQMGLRSLHARLHDPTLAPHLHGIFPTDHPKNIRFSINFFTAIGLGALTSGLRELLTSLQTQPQDEEESTEEEAAEEEESASSSGEESSKSSVDRRRRRRSSSGDRRR